MKHTINQRGGIYSLSEDVEMKAKLSSLTRRLEELEMRNQHEVRAVVETLVPLQPCFNFQSTSHQGEHCPIAPSVRDLMQEQANIVGQSKPRTNGPYGNTYNPNWRNHPNLSWKPKPSAYAPTGSQQQQHLGSTSQQQQPPPSSPVEQAIVNLNKVVGNFVEEQKTMNAQTTQKIETLEGTLNKKIDDMQYSVSRLTNQQQVLEKENFPSQTQPNPRGVHELSSASDPNPRIDEVKQWSL